MRLPQLHNPRILSTMSRHVVRSFVTCIDFTSSRSPGKAGASSGSESAANGGDCVYKLACVLYHKGSSVHSGHYIAEVRGASVIGFMY